MDRDDFVKRLDFEDISMTLPTNASPVMTPFPERGDTEKGSTTPSKSLVDLQDNITIEDLRQEAQRIRETLSSMDVKVSNSVREQAKSEAEAQDTGLKELKKMFATLTAEYLELSAKEDLLKKRAESQIGDDHQDENWLADESASDVDTMREELTALKSANAETILEIESLIRTIANDVDGLETDISVRSSCLDDFDLEVDKVAKQGTPAPLDNKMDGHSSLLKVQPEDLQDLETTIKTLEEQLRQNEKDYVEAEAAMKSRIEQYDLEMEELQAQANQLDREEVFLRMLVDVSFGCLQPQKHMECSGDVSLISADDGYIELRLTTMFPTSHCSGDSADHGGIPPCEHKLHIKVHQSTMEIEDAELIPGDVPIEDILAEAQRQSESVKGAEVADSGRQLAYFVRTVHKRTVTHVLRLASLSSVSSDPRYCVTYLPDSSVITVTKPGKFKALVEVPQEWPMHGFSLRLQSLESLDSDCRYDVTTDTIEKALEEANEMPEHSQHDLLSYIQALETVLIR